jgi:hypothetical protein
MSERWKYGSYQFRINPSSSDQSIEIIGDNVRTLTGALIAQPTAMVENYSLSSVFFQGRTRLISEFSISKCDSFDLYNGNIYVLNKTDDRIDIYNSNLSLTSSISLAGVAEKQYLSFDVTSSGFWLISDGPSATFYAVHKIDFSGNITPAFLIARAVEDQLYGIEEFGAFVFLLIESRIEQYAFPNVTKLDTIFLPSVFYNGLSSDGNYLLVGEKDNFNNNVVYHIDTANGNIVNSTYSESITGIHDVAYDGTYLYIYNSAASKVQKIKGNTVLLDIYSLEKEIENNKFVIMTDDLGTERRVRVESLSKQQRIQNEIAFDVSIKVSKINRG